MGGPGGAKPVVRAGFLRNLLLRLDQSWATRTPGVRIKGARIEGVLDLTDCSGEGLPALSLVECEIPETVDLSHARLARVSFERSRLSRLVAIEAEIAGELNLCAVAPFEAPGRETLTAKLRSVRIDGDMLARDAKVARAVDSDDDALMLQGADIKGNLLLDGAFESFGCVWLMSGKIDGAFACEGAPLLNRSEDTSGQAINADAATPAPAAGPTEGTPITCKGPQELSKITIKSPTTPIITAVAGCKLVLKNPTLQGPVAFVASGDAEVRIEGGNVTGVVTTSDKANVTMKGVKSTGPFNKTGQSVINVM